MANSDKGFDIDIVTPQQLFFSGEVSSVTAPGLDGLFQVMKNHAPLLAALKQGNVKLVLADKSEKSFAIKDGFFEVSGNKAILLTEDIA
ncbi:MAG: ATP synthase F1 subunit epsilon [Chlorobium sp.]|jgi:F-type H+-transporting ATPase subunit epsilon|uniref:ATP synthase F1 subunit epsilon n=1 Tax=Chlorobium sp. TaxID=1095 RepID=UPI001E17B18D|nr:ATP synthase F1 subunit epsilon [Chlorobium sp.]MBN1278315.1 ATP synthase F1 subunit epsilon [Chlorobiaceae bacterium]MCF8216877.1 ATP synthase F1 subunit epsilon [Chlorobium sp.]MCF8271706.1 ATP synthase F1 subunit epsilon [Chlorobium sp.]MCF8288094.1 ATP synthase F1 subunit epsilon [Chlorobium sp.]MCF8291685.1 ATP synthase F1 subunit epsilon [Chlorobium sp.]